MKDFKIDWSKVAPEHRPEKLHGVIEIYGQFVEYDGERRYVWPMGHDYPLTNQPKIVVIWGELNNTKLRAQSASLTEAKIGLCRQYQHTKIFEQFKEQHPTLTGKQLLDAFWTSKEYKQWCKDLEGDSDETAQIS